MQAQEETTIKTVREYKLEIAKNKTNITGKDVMGMTVNGTIPGPVLEFTEGEQAVIHVKNTMDVETSVHWHGLLLPNFQDGVPYLTTPPIKPGATLYGLRAQKPISDIQYMKAMIPHHSSAILVSNNVNLKDPEVIKLSKEIIKAQEKEIAQMKAAIERIENNN
ncbi:hypothetical protein ULMS_09100 [Patiriisocius marinistellae]|uniref:Plastocyanin-like domain-containing protein n=1 Tax=Patiriisocius marinistellae TaxID=2494560 RepID=A0A5J4FW49_9FLAO|nr:hypothetical protein ULMS_09100 [Patiriisocius marinistellae]